MFKVCYNAATELSIQGRGLGACYWGACGGDGWCCLLRPVSTVRGCSLQMPLGECSALPRTVDTGVARYEAFASHNVRRAVCLSVLEQCSKVPRSELCVKWIPALSASHRKRYNSAPQTNKPPQRNCHHG
ncbi:hypothetical protein J6590_042957 [Homalodisca vitripennis]|nr:hypothetical protein J6590_042957 [Homalodisca vitripennis]